MKHCAPVARRLGAVLGTLALATAFSTPAHARTLDTLTGTLTGIIGTPVPTGWLFDDSQTTMSDVRTSIRADSMWQRGYTGKHLSADGDG